MLHVQDQAHVEHLGRQIVRHLAAGKDPDRKRVEDILARSRAIETLEPEETAALLGVRDPDTWEEMFRTASEIKRKVYDNRIVVFAPLYLGNLCVNNCLYCGFRGANETATRRVLAPGEVKKEVGVLAGEIGHKRLIVVYGEHPSTGIDYMVSTIRDIYDVKVKTRNGWGQIRRVNVNAPPLQVEELRELGAARNW